ncbi:MvdC/MvdD family ATP grasp protein [Cellulomonas fimi]|uniref:Alpha-L-glutamate ligase n=1 Tax=Cellulomonas fimi TaxID=1708 RepID=A0A7Y0M073_CELFI|nr:alpha-L-glutamate ligase [Cellulomonas fimi]NMR21446.1 alpha-L-glutamate ligase [Cellulomonas fimi]
MIGIIAGKSDVHAAGVAAQLRALGSEPVLLDTGHVPTQVRVTSRHSVEEPWRATWVEPGDSGEVVTDLTALRAVWWRRPQHHELHPELTTEADRRFAYQEVDAAVRGIWSCTDAVWVNDPDRDLAGSRKLHQLKVAAELGLRIPRTCATTDPAQARAFLAAEPAGAIYKPFLGTEEAWAETRLVEAVDVANLGHLRFAPVIFQELVPGGLDIRVTVVGRDVHAAEIRAHESSYEFDFRMDQAHASIHRHELPGPLVDRLHALMDRFGLLYGAIDLRRAPDGDYVFLEVNPAGQFLFVEYATGQPITGSMARLLQSLDRGDGVPAPVLPAARGSRSVAGSDGTRASHRAPLR